ncbi:hypothetical protein M409DRAFT_19120 [Zasmidium cellare ATCC 36951]|uniref:Transmembrane protein n=1 Tax=Zasmidium cellare ATCC 36951 TaxID=1080233 RepID=A0A6A6CZB1_ZASCE|nr:uncharacterized protein M409DRAFT_19120 [Zasmidium cellare ATCC 36951]KAF2171149.1 hypothetical protein M409DRAFT_19120 [Zasmidium cellare ATCC 36951]
MRYQNLSEKKRSSVVSRSKSLSTTSGCVMIIICQHILLWSALYVAASAIYALAVEAVVTNNIPSIVMFLVGSCLSLFYLVLQNVTTHLRKRARDRWQSERVDTYQSLATFVLRRFLVLAWVVTSVLAIVLTASRGVLWPCQPESDSRTMPLDVGTTCVVNRVEMLACIITALASASLFILSHMVHEPSRCHLFGYITEQDLLPLFLPYRASHDRPPLFSDMSFKCRSSSSLSTQTAIGPCSYSTTHLLACSEPKQPLGLGIYTGHRSAPSLLRPRPSLASIRSHVSVHLPPPPTEPLPPLPAYFPEKYHQPTTTIHTAIYPPRKLYGLHPNSSLNVVRIITPPSPALSKDNLTALNRSNESQNSLSSVYSRSISGDRPSPPPRKLSESDRTMSSSSTGTVKRSPLGAMRLAEDPENVVMARSRMSSSSSESEIDDVAALQARVQRVDSREGLVKTSELEGYVDRQIRFSLKPLNVRQCYESTQSDQSKALI